MLSARRLVGFVRPYAGLLIASLILTVVGSLLDGFTFALLIPFLRILFQQGGPLVAEGVTGVERLLHALVGFALPSDARQALRNVVLLMVCGIALKNAATYAAGVLNIRVREGVARDLRAAVFAHVQKMGLQFFQRTRSGDLLSRVTSDADQARHAVSDTLVANVQNALLALVYLAILFSISWRLTMLTLLLAPAIVLALRPVFAKIRAGASGAFARRGDLSTVTNEALEGVRVVKSHGAEAYQQRRFGRAARAYAEGMIRGQRLALLAQPVSETLGAAVLLLLLLFGMALTTGDAAGLRPELFLVFVTVSLRLLSPVKKLSQFPLEAQFSLTATQRIFGLLDEIPDDVDERDRHEFPGVLHEIRFVHVGFRYEGGPWVLRNVDLTVRRGETIAIVGPSGSGKSTLLDLLPRFADPQRGQVLVDGVSIADFSRVSLRRAIGVVSQHTVLFNDTVHANIAFGDHPNVSREDVVRAATLADAHDFILELPEGYDTNLGERGMLLSGGERQRIAIARAVLRDPPVLILDEATSALDTTAARIVYEALARVARNRTVFVVAHRLSTAAQADRIIVLHRGRIVEEGHHETLRLHDGMYRRLSDASSSDATGPSRLVSR